MAAMDTAYDRLAAAGIPLIYLSMGSPEQGRALMAKLGIKGALYVDPATTGTTDELRSRQSKNAARACVTSTPLLP
jgi:hypothetical protein